MQAWPEFPEPPRRLLAAWWALALVALGLSTLMAVVLVAARTPFLGLGGEFFRTALVLHVDLAVVVWFLAVAVGIWVVAAPVEGRLPTALAWSGAWLAAGGVVLALGAPWWGGAVPVLANYVPVIDSLAFICGLGMFIGGVVLSAALALPGFLRVGRKGPRAEWQWAAGAALLAFVAAMAVFALAQWDATAASGFEDRVWGAGHVLQSVHTLMLMSAWLVLGEKGMRRLPGVRRLVAALIVIAGLAPLADLWVAASFPLDSATYRLGFTEVMRWGIWPAAVALAVLQLGGLLWRRSAPLDANAWGLLASIGLFLLGCAVGAGIRGETTAVPAHYHGTVGAVTLAYMLWGRQWAPRFGLRLPTGGLWKLQPFVYALGIALLVAGLGWSGWLGVPRKAPHADLEAMGAAYRVAMGLAGIGGTLAMLGAGTFVVMLFRAIRRKRSEGMQVEEPRKSGWRLAGEERWRLLLLAGVAVVVGGIALDSVDRSPLNGGIESATHVKVKRKEEIDRRFKEGVVMLHAKQYEHALTAFHRVLELAPEMPEAYVNAGYALLGMGDARKARDFFDNATNLRPGQLNAYFGLGEALAALGDTLGALQAMETYVHLAPKEDPYRRKAESAAWELRTKLDEQRAQSGPGISQAGPASKAGGKP